MSLLEDVNSANAAWSDFYKNIYSFEDYISDLAWYADDDKVRIVGPTTVDTWRWGTVEQLVFIRGDEIVAVQNQESSGDNDSEWWPEIFEAVEQKTVQYVRKPKVLKQGNSAPVDVDLFA